MRGSGASQRNHVFETEQAPHDHRTVCPRARIRSHEAVATRRNRPRFCSRGESVPDRPHFGRRWWRQLSNRLRVSNDAVFNVLRVTSKLSPRGHIRPLGGKCVGGFPRVRHAALLCSIGGAVQHSFQCSEATRVPVSLRCATSNCSGAVWGSPLLRWRVRGSARRVPHVTIEHQRDRAIVNEFDLHVSTETASLDRRSKFLKGMHEMRDQRL